MLDILYSVFIPSSFSLSSFLTLTNGVSLVAMSGGLLFVAVCGLLIVVASLVAEHRL